MKKLIIILILIAYGLNSQTLDEYLKEAASNNPLLKAKYKEYEQQLLNAPQLSAIPDPSLSLGYFVTRPYTRVGPQNFKLSYVQKLPWFGTLSDYEKESLQLAEAKRMDFEQVKVDIFYNIRSNLFELYRIDKELEFKQKSLSLLEYIIPIVKTKVEVNNARLSDLLRMELIVSELETELELLTLDIIPINEELKQLLNRSVNDSITAPDDINLKLDHNNLNEKLTSNPSVEKLEILKEVTELRAKTANSESNPSITLGLDYINVSPMTDMIIPNNGLDIIMPMIGVSIPFFSDKYSAKEEQALLMKEQYEFEQINLINNLNSKYESVISMIESDKRKVELYEKQIEKSEQIRNLLLEEYRSIANEDIQDVIEIEQKIIGYKTLKLNAEVSNLDRKAQLIRIVGE